ncbi:MAG: zf-HC2 domain-containing protein [bacterium]
MRCGKARALVSSYLDKEISNNDLISVNDHLKECAHCSEYFREIKEQDLKLVNLSGISIPEMDEEKIVKYWQAHKALQERSWFPRYWPYIAAPAAALLIFAVIRITRVNKGFQYYDLNEKQAKRIEYLAPESQLKYRAGVILADLRNNPESVSLDKLREEITKGNFLPDIQKAKNEAIKNKDFKTYDLLNKIEFVLIDIMNRDKPDFYLADLVQI